MDAREVAGGLERPRENGNGWMACCPAHEDRNPSLSISDGDKGIVVKCFAGCSQREVIDALKSRGLWPTPTPTRVPTVTTTPTRKLTATYRYVDADGVLQFEVLRYTPKTFRQRRPDGDGWAWNLQGVTRVPYRLPELLASDRGVCIVEGEKDCDALIALGVTATTFAGGAGKWVDTYADWFKRRTVFIIPDNDDPGRDGAQLIAARLHGVAASVHIVALPDVPEKGDVSDWLDAGGTKAGLSELCSASPVWEPPTAPTPMPTPEPTPEPTPTVTESTEVAPAQGLEGVDALLLKTDKGEIKPGPSNALVLLAWHPEMVGAFAFDTFANQVIVTQPVPWSEPGEQFPRPRRDSDDVFATAWLESLRCPVPFSTTYPCINAVAEKRKINPLVDWLQSLVWDGTPRIGRFLVDCMGAEDSEYNRITSRRWFIQCVARPNRPGCKSDTMLILEGGQGQQKSSALKLLFGEQYFHDSMGSIGAKDTFLQMRGRWCIENAELATIQRADHNKLKEFLSSSIDRYRPPYGRTVQEVPRSSVFVGTVNPDSGYLKDATGGRRFWPVETGRFDYDAITEQREQLWAEAMHAFREGEQWWLLPYEEKLAQEEQAARYESDPWHDEVVAFIDGRMMVSVHAVLDRLSIPKAQQNQLAQNRVSKVLSHLGWKRVRRTINSRRTWVYVPKEGA